MKKTIIFLIMVFTGTFIIAAQSNISRFISDDTVRSQEMLSCKYFNEMRFRKSLSLTSDVTTNTEQVKGGIVPHHLLTDEMIADFFKAASVKQPETVIIIGPNHTGAGVSKIHTAKWDWKTPFGILESDDKVIDYLIKGEIADTNFELMENDHAISALVPYIKYFMPDTKIVPILVSGTYSTEEAEWLGAILGRFVKDEDSLMIASVDFSHYLSLEQANKNDSMTRKALEDRNIQQISCMNNDFMDSPASIITLLSAMNEVEAYNHKEISHSNSAIISGQGYDYTTSYFTYIFY